MPCFLTSLPSTRLERGGYLAGVVSVVCHEGQGDKFFLAQAAFYHPSHCILILYCTVSDQIDLLSERKVV